MGPATRYTLRRNAKKDLIFALLPYVLVTTKQNLQQPSRDGAKYNLVATEIIHLVCMYVDGLFCSV